MVVEEHPSPTGPCFLRGTEKQPFFLQTISFIFFFFFSRHFFAFVKYCKSWEKLAKARASVWSLKWCKSGSDVAPWGPAGSDAQILRASPQCHAGSRTELPSLLGRQWESGCFLLFWTEEAPANKKSTVSFVCDSPHHGERLFLSSKCEWNPASFHFSDALDYWRCLIHIYFCHLFLTTFFFLINQASELSEK